MNEINQNTYEWFKEKHTKNLKYDQNYCRLNIEIDICTELMLDKYILMGPMCS